MLSPLVECNEVEGQVSKLKRAFQNWKALYFILLVYFYELLSLCCLTNSRRNIFPTVVLGSSVLNS